MPLSQLFRLDLSGNAWFPRPLLVKDESFIVVSARGIAGPLGLRVVSFLVRRVCRYNGIREGFSGGFNHSLDLIKRLFPFAFPCEGCYRCCPLCHIGISNKPYAVPPSRILPRITIGIPIRTFCYPVRSNCYARPPNASIGAKSVRPPLKEFLAVEFSLHYDPCFSGHRVSVPLFPIHGRIVSAGSATCSNLCSTVFGGETFQVCVRELYGFSVILGPVSRDSLIYLRLSGRVATFFPSFVCSNFLRKRNIYHGCTS